MKALVQLLEDGLLEAHPQMLYLSSLSAAERRTLVRAFFTPYVKPPITELQSLLLLVQKVELLLEEQILSSESQWKGWIESRRIRKRSKQ